MTPLVLKEISARFTDDAFVESSVLYQLFSLNRDHLPTSTLLQAMDEVSDAALQEQDRNGRSLLLNHLGRQTIRWFKTTMASRDALMSTLTQRSSVEGAKPVLRPELVVAMRLLDRGVDPWLQDVDGRDALDQALHLMWLPVIERLLSMPGAPDVAGLEARRLTVHNVARPLLHHAVRGNNHVLVELLLARGLNVNALDHEGHTPLFLVTSEAMAQRLMDAGADLNHRTINGQDVTAYWVRASLDSNILTRLNLMVTEGLRKQAQAEGKDLGDREEEQNRWRPTLYDLARSGTKDNVIRTMRTHGFTADDTGSIDGKPQRLLTTVARHLINNPGRSPAVAQHLLERSSWLRQTDDPAGAATLFTFWLAAIGMTHDSSGAGAPKEKLLATVEKLLDERFAWRTPEGMARFVAAFLPLAEKLMPRPSGEEGQAVPTQQEYRWARGGALLFRALDRALFGQAVRFDSRNQADVPAWEQRAQVEPGVRLFYDVDHRGVTRATEARIAFMDPSWTRMIRSDGLSYAWAWGSLAVQMFLGRPRNGVALPMTLRQQQNVWSMLLNGDTLIPAAPRDAMAFNTALVLADGGKTNPDALHPGWDATLPEHTVARALLHPEAAIATSLPFFNERMMRLRQHRPTIAMEVEGMLLRQAAHEASAPDVESGGERMAKRPRL